MILQRFLCELFKNVSSFYQMIRLMTERLEFNLYRLGNLQQSSGSLSVDGKGGIKLHRVHIKGLDLD